MGGGHGGGAAVVGWYGRAVIQEQEQVQGWVQRRKKGRGAVGCRVKWGGAEGEWEVRGGMGQGSRSLPRLALSHNTYPPWSPTHPMACMVQG